MLASPGLQTGLGQRGRDGGKAGLGHPVHRLPARARPGGGGLGVREDRIPDEDIDGALLTYKLTRCTSLQQLRELAGSRAEALNTIHIAALAARVGIGCSVPAC